MTQRDDENTIALPDLGWLEMAPNVSQRCLLIPHPLFKELNMHTERRQMRQWNGHFTLICNQSDS